MSDLSGREQAESPLRSELSEADQRLRRATQADALEARRRFEEALRAFSRLVVDGRFPSDANDA